jgi:hypothetical protein
MHPILRWRRGLRVRIGLIGPSGLQLGWFGLGGLKLIRFGSLGCFLTPFGLVASARALADLGFALAGFAFFAGFTSRAMPVSPPNHGPIFRPNDYSGMDALSLWFIIA